MRQPTIAVLLLGLLRATGAGALCDPELCAPGADPCRVARSCEFASPVTVDLGGRALVIARGVTVQAVRSLAVLAGSITLEPGAALVAPDYKARGGGGITLDTPGRIALEADGEARARIDVTGEFIGGSISLRAAEGVAIGGLLTAGTRQFGLGGLIDVETEDGGVTIESGAEIVARADSPGKGGLVSIETRTGRVDVRGLIDVRGGDGGSADLFGAGGITISDASVLDLRAIDTEVVRGGGNGGEVWLESWGDLVVEGRITARGARVSTAYSGIVGGDGGFVEVMAEGDVALRGAIDLCGALPTGSGGGVSAEAGGRLTQEGAVVATGKGRFGGGGMVDLRAGGILALGPVDVDGGGSGGGMVDVESSAAIVVPMGVRIDADSAGDMGGDLWLSAPIVSIGGMLSVRGRGSGSGGSVRVSGCEVSVPAGARLMASGGDGGGMIDIEAGTALVLGSQVRATGEGGTTAITYGFASPPAVPANTFRPPPEFSQASPWSFCLPVTTTSSTIPATAPVSQPVPGVEAESPPEPVAAPSSCPSEVAAPLGAATCRLLALGATIRAAGPATGAAARGRERLAQCVSRVSRRVGAADGAVDMGAARRFRRLRRHLRRCAQAVRRSPAISLDLRASIGEAVERIARSLRPLASRLR